MPAASTAGSPCWVCAALAAKVPGKLALMRLNRAMAWALVISPVCQIAFGMNVWRGLLFDLVLLIVHGVLSMWLFGPPRAGHARENGKPVARGIADHVMLATGLAQKPASLRQQLLLGGYRILLGVAYLLAIALAGWLRLHAEVVMLLMVGGAYVMLRLPFSSLGHLHDATIYAARRNGARDPELIAVLLVSAFVATSTYNLLR